jgi:ABC-type multidrug transport system fused ATPase/permease subunit
MVSGDVEEMDDACWYIHFVWSCPFQLIVSVVLLYRLVGWCVFAGISVMLLSMPAQALVARVQRRVTNKLMQATDARLKATNELFTGIRIVKFMVWEKKFIDQVTELRKAELSLFKQAQRLRVATVFISSTSPSLVMAGVFLAYHLSGHRLTPEVIFPTMALLNILRFPFTMIPVLITFFVGASVSMKRIAKFFDCEDTQQLQDLESQESEGATSCAHEGTNGSKDTSSLKKKIDEFAAIVNHASITVYVPQAIDFTPPPSLRARLGKRLAGCCCCCSSKPKAEGDGEGDGAKGKGKGKGKAKEKEAEFYALNPKNLLSDVSVKFPKGKFTIITGPTGCGKTTLIEALLGELEVTAGNVYCEQNVAYVPQQAWILNSTFKENILFFTPYDEAWFQQTIDCCELGPDIAHLFNGVDTEIGERGVTLSGGQKARVGLARAVYSRRSLYLLDDPLSAVDAHVSHKLVHQCFLNVLAGTTRILVTHQHQYMQNADHIIVMSEHGTIFFEGTFADYNERYSASTTPLNSRSHSTMFTGSPKTGAGGTKPQFPDAPAGKVSEEESRVQPRSETDQAPTNDSKASASFGETAANAAPPASEALAKPTSGEDETVTVFVDQPEQEGEGDANGTDQAANKGAGEAKDKEKGKLMTQEEKATGYVAKAVYVTYFKACGGLPSVLWLCLLYTLCESANLGESIWLSLWSEDRWHLRQSWYLYAYIGFVVFAALVVTIRAWVTYETFRQASLKLHYLLLVSVTRAPMRFFDTTPLGRVLNRFAKDINSIDNDLPFSWQSLFALMFSLVGNLTLMIVSQPFVLIPIVPLGYVYWRILRFYNAANRELKRQSSVAKSPIFALLTEAISGHRCITAFGKTQDIMRLACTRLDNLMAVSMLQSMSARWLAVRLELMGNFIIFSMALAGTIGKMTGFAGQDAALLSLGITLSMSLTSTLTWLVRQLAQVEATMNAVERVAHYAQGLDQEETWQYDDEGKKSKRRSSLATENDKLVSAAGPVSHPRPDIQSNSIEFSNVCLRYREGLPLVLSNLSFTIREGEKVGIVGRTGSGKSTLMLALLRIVEVTDGEIRLGGVSTRKLTLDDLRSRFAMIPQDPLLFQGTIKSNLDPFEESTDEECWEALRRVGMEDRIRNGISGTTESSSPSSSAATPPPQGATDRATQDVKGLTALVLEGGKNFSVGQRQLLCMARAMLQRKAKIVLMDEATANIDPELDAVIQKTIRTAFVHHTVITIAHRLNTVLDADKIILLNKGGTLGEFGEPSTLVDQPNGLLRQMIAASGPVQEKKLINFVKQAAKRKSTQS